MKTLLITWTPLFVALSSPQEREVRDNVLTSADNPALAIRVEDERFVYAGRHFFDIRGLAGGERHVFVDAEDQRVARLVIVQLEGFYEGNGGIYRYDLTSSPEVAGYRWRSNGYAFDLASSRRDDPGNESSVTANFLEAYDYRLPTGLMMWRTLTVTNAARTHEAIIFYMVDMGESTLDDFYQDDRDTSEWIAIQARLEREFHRIVSLAPVASSREIAGDAWAKVPLGVMEENR